MVIVQLQIVCMNFMVVITTDVLHIFSAPKPHQVQNYKIKTISHKEESVYECLKFDNLLSNTYTITQVENIKEACFNELK